MKIGLVQYNPVWENKEENKKQLEKLIESNNEDISLLIFPEMTLTGFTMQSSLQAEEVSGDSISFFKSIAKRKNCHVVAGSILKEGNNIFNSAIHLNEEGEIQKVYNKIHPFSMSGEDIKYSAGEKPVITKIGDIKTGLSICYDLRFPELFRFYAKQKVDLIIDIANWPSARIEHWRTLLKARAIENQCFVIGVNRTGSDPVSKYNGFSSVYDPTGKEIVTVENKEEMITANLDIQLVQETRNKYPFLNDIKLL